jgi:PIN domain nuclease of toxin-antitoxin system
MKHLLDTHALLWWESDPHLLSPTALAVILAPGSDLLLSVASGWEMQIKQQAGKLKLVRAWVDIVTDQQANLNLQLLPVTLDHVREIDQLPSIHRDPFDRLLVAQARVEGAALITADKVLGRYPVRVVW